MLYTKETTGKIDAVVERLQQAAAENRFGVLGLHDLKEKMNAKGVNFNRECRVLEVCNPVQAQKVLTANMTISTALPCRISVYEEDGKIKVATLRPTVLLDLFETPELRSVAQDVEDSIVRIIDTACALE